MARDRFFEFTKAAILSLSQDLKAVLHIVEDADVPDAARATLAGAVVHFLSGKNTIPGVRGVLGYVDDVLVLRLALQEVVAAAPDAAAAYGESYPSLVGTLADDLALCEEHMGAGLTVIKKAMPKLGELKHLGRSAQECIRDEEAGTMLYEEVQAALVDLDLEEDEVARELKGIEPVLEALRRRAAQ